MKQALSQRNELESKYNDVMKVTFINIKIGKKGNLQSALNKNYLDKDKDKILIEALTVHTQREKECQTKCR